MEIMINKKDLEQAREFVESGALVSLMNEEGLSMGAMAIVLDSLFKGFDGLEARFNAEEV